MDGIQSFIHENSGDIKGWTEGEWKPRDQDAGRRPNAGGQLRQKRKFRHPPASLSVPGTVRILSMPGSPAATQRQEYGEQAEQGQGRRFGNRLRAGHRTRMTGSDSVFRDAEIGQLVIGRGRRRGKVFLHRSWFRSQTAKAEMAFVLGNLESMRKPEHSRMHFHGMERPAPVSVRIVDRIRRDREGQKRQCGGRTKEKSFHKMPRSWKFLIKEPSVTCECKPNPHSPGKAETEG